MATMSKKFDKLPNTPITLEDAMTWALNFLNFGRLRFCDVMCDNILRVAPGHVNAGLVRGVCAYKRGDYPRAIALLGEAAQGAARFADAWHHYGMALFLDKQLDAAAAAFARAMDCRENYPEAMAGLGEIRRLQGRDDEAFPLLEKALKLKFNYSPAYISYSLMCFDRSAPPNQPPPPRRPRQPGPKLTMSSLGNYGRFAQTVNEYVAVRLYAETYGMAFETPDWVGHRFFQLDDPLIAGDFTAGFDEWLDVRDRFAAGFDGSSTDPYRDCDLFLGGSPINPMRRAHQDKVRGWLTPRPCWNDRLSPCVDAARARGRTLVVLHIRQTDWWNQEYTPLSLYVDWLTEAWSSFDDPALFICTDEPKTVEAFAAWRPMTSADFPVRWEGLEYLQDFHLMTQADVLAISTGSFAQTAAALNRDARLLLRPADGNKTLEAFDPWD